MSDSWRPHGLQPTSLLRRWDFPGKSTGVGCPRLLWRKSHNISFKMSVSISHYIVLKVKVKLLSHVRFFATQWTVSTRLLCPWNSPGKNIGMSCQSLIQGIFLTQGSNLGLQHYRQILYCLSYLGSPLTNFPLTS